ncbi:MAG: ABC transporter substrate-binding protein [Candidatus Dormibacteraeota bacterium]|nr:ABC transporter substrate-binding protein [Candidatus Dormibacteraeota bacterium]
MSSSMLWVGATASQSAAWLGAEGGYFKQNGVDMDLSFQSGSPTAAASLAGGHVDFVQMAGPAVVTADAKGGHLVMVMGIVTKPTFVLMTGSDVQTPDQLEGKSLGVVQVGSSDDFMLRAGLERWGLQPDRDVKIVPLQSIQGQIAGFQKHLVQGLVVDPPNDLLAGRAGAHLLARIADLGIPYQAAGLVTTQTFLRDHRGTVTKVAQAMIQAIHRFKTDRRFAQQVMGRYLKTNDGKTLEDAYDEFSPTFPQVPLPSQAGLQEIVTLDVQAGTIKAPVRVTSLADPSIVGDLQKNGFIQRVYGA